MKKISFFCLFLSLILIFGCNVVVYDVDNTFPKPKGWVSDYANLIDPHTENKLNLYIEQLKKTTGSEIAILTIPTTKPLNINEYAVRLFEKWGIGEKGKDNGLLILIAKNDKKFRIEVGYGLEGCLPDGLCGEIARKYMIPRFKEGNFSAGLYQTTIQLINTIYKEYNIKPQSIYKEIYSKSPIKREKLNIEKIFTSLFWIILLLSIMFGGGGAFFLPFFLGTMIGSRPRWTSNRYSDCFGAFGGGFGGFGGGLSGGGGVSGSW